MKKQYRLLKNEDFKKVLDAKSFCSNSSFVLRYRQNDLGQIRIGISVSRQLGNAVQRNRYKRQVRMMIDDVFSLECSYDMVLILRKGYLDKKFSENLEELKYLYKKFTKRGDN